MTHPSVADIPESSLVQRLLADRYWRSTILNIRGIPDQALDFERVSLRGAPGSFLGDVDIILCPESEPASATAIEVKRIKVSAGAFRRGRPNKLHEFGKGVRQANLLAAVGFSQVYLYILVVIDSRDNSAGGATYDGATSELRNAIRGAMSIAGLEPRIGLVHHEFVQSVDDAPLGRGAYFGHLERIAQAAKQSTALTEWVAQVVARQTLVSRREGAR